MASTTAMYSALSGMNANARKLDVIGNNIANANTTAFKSSRMLFQTQFSRTLSDGTEPSTDSGGTNPYQIGLGVAIAGTQLDFANGTISATGDARDLAIDGPGFFIVDRGNQRFYTRDGSFRQDAENNLVNIDGARLQGYQVDSDFNLTGALGDITIPVGLSLVEPTTTVRFDGNLKADGAVATQGSSIQLGSSPTLGFGLIPSATVPPTGTDLLETNSLIVEIADPQAPTNPLFAPGQTIRVQDAKLGSSTLPSKEFAITATSTVQDLMNFLADALGINTTTGANPNGPTPGVSLDASTGRLTITGNIGTVNDLEVSTTDIQVLNAAGTQIGTPFNSTDSADATGESVRTTFVVFDSLGSPVQVNLTMVLDSKSNTGTSWRYFVDSIDDTDPSPAVATGMLNFDVNGQLTSSGEIPIQIDRAGTGAATPLAITLDLDQGADNVTALSSQKSEIAATFQDGAPLGQLAAFGVGDNGIIIGTFTNGLTRTLGQVALAAFTNQEGLIQEGANLFQVGPDSGTPIVTTPGSFGTGPIVGGALELSNVDLGQQFIDMITTSTGYTACSRVIRTCDELLQQLLVLGR